MKNYIVNKIQNLLGITALKTFAREQVNLRIESEAKLSLRIKELQDQLDEMPSNREIVVRSDIEDFISERDLNRAIEDAIDEQDWDSIVSDALSDRQTSRALDEAIDENLRNQDVECYLVRPLIEELSAGNKDLVEAITYEVNNCNKLAEAKKPLPVS